MIQLDDISLQTVQNILRSTKLSRPYEFRVFGSRATQTASNFSDIDIAMNSASGTGPANISDIALLNEQFELSKLPYKVDLVDLARVNDALRQEVAAHGQKVSV